jgi:hypothetical protein
MSDFLMYVLGGLGICLVVLVLFFVLIAGVASLATVEGNYTVYPQTGEPFQIKKYMNLDNSIYYTKPDGTTGKVYGNFRVEQTTLKTEKE